jgi:hypothetical protein
MLLIELGQVVWVHAHHTMDALVAVADKIAAPPDPGTVDKPKEINTDGLVKFFSGKVAPILLAVLGLIFIGRAGKGEVSKVMTSSAIAIIGLAFIAGAGALFFFGDYLVNLAFK